MTTSSAGPKKRRFPPRQVCVFLVPNFIGFCSGALLLPVGVVGAVCIALRKVRCGRLGARLFLLAGVLLAGGAMAAGVHHNGLLIMALMLAFLGWTLWEAKPDDLGLSPWASLLPGVAAHVGMAGATRSPEPHRTPYQSSPPARQPTSHPAKSPSHE